MKRRLLFLAGPVLALIGGGLFLREGGPAQAEPAAAPAYHDATAVVTPTVTADLGGECAIAAVDLIGAWVEAQAPEGEFAFTSDDGQACTGAFEQDILPLFTEAGIWFPGSQACVECHFANSADSRHELDLSSYAGVMAGADVVSSPPGVPIVVPGDWEASGLRGRLRNNRMPPGWTFDITEGNRNGPTLTVDGGEVSAVDLIGAWVEAQAPEGEFAFTSDDGQARRASFEQDILPLFTEADIWFPGSQACVECHFANSADSRHELDLSSYAGVMAGADVVSSPPGVPIVVPGDWEASGLRGRLRNNRMPPGWTFDITEGNRNGPTVHAGLLAGDLCRINAVDLIGAWVEAQAPEGEFAFTANDGQACTGTFEEDILPLFTEADIWFPGSQACVECHFANSADSRHELDLSSYAGVMAGADVVSSPPGVPIVVPGDWEASGLRGRLRNNRMPPGWTFDITEGNRNGPTLTVDGGEVSAVDLIGAWVEAQAPEGEFAFTANDGQARRASFEQDILPLFTEADIWFPGSQACVECHFANSADSRHELDLSSYAGVMAGADVVSSPPGVPIVVPGDWEASGLRGRLRNNRMPPGWTFDITEGNRNGPVIVAGQPAGGLSAPAPSATTAPTSPPPPTAVPTVAPTPVPTPAPTRTESRARPDWPWALVLLSGLGMTLGVAVSFVYFNRLRSGQERGLGQAAGWAALILAGVTTALGAVALQSSLAGAMTEVVTIHEAVPFAYIVTATPDTALIYDSPAARIEAWQARLPQAYAELTNPFPPNDNEAVIAGRHVYFDHKCDVCHGADLKGDGEFSRTLSPRPVDLTDGRLMNLPFVTDNYLFWRISEGGSDEPFQSAMPMWDAQLSPQERWQLVAFIRSQTVVSEAAPADQAAIAVIEKAGCFACHQLENRGGKVGPSWDDIGRTAATRISGVAASTYLRQAILDPGAFIVAGFEDKAELMPRTYRDTLTSEEVDLIVEFLEHQGGE